jgi:hypothetical protein
MSGRGHFRTQAVAPGRKAAAKPNGEAAETAQESSGMAAAGEDLDLDHYPPSMVG